MKSQIFQATFTDVYGVPHANAQCMIAYFSANNNVYFDDAGESNNQSGTCSYQVRYWHSQEAKDAGARPQEFMDANMANTFYAEVDLNATNDELMAKCKQHFIDDISKAKALVA